MKDLVIIPKGIRVPNCYGSHLEIDHIKKCIQNSFLSIDILNEFSFYKNKNQYKACLFIGLSSSAKNFILNDSSVFKTIWSNNQFESFSNKKLFEKVGLIFDQSNWSFLLEQDNCFCVPTAFQNDRNIINYVDEKYDLMFNGSLYRLRKYNPLYRVDVLLKLMNKGIKIGHFNGGGKTNSNEWNLIQKYLINHPNYNLITEWSEPYHYSCAKFVLNLPFMCSGGRQDKDWGINIKKIENGIWFHSWDVFRAIGARANMICFESPEIKELGVDETHCHFYKSTPMDVDLMVDEIYYHIINSPKKSFDEEVYNNNTYLSRWSFMLNKIEEVI